MNLRRKRKCLLILKHYEKKMEELEKKELLKQQDKLKMSSKKKKNEKSLPSTSTSTKVTDEDLTSGLLNITSKLGVLFQSSTMVPVLKRINSNKSFEIITLTGIVFLNMLITNIFLFPFILRIFTPVQPIVIQKK